MYGEGQDEPTFHGAEAAARDASGAQDYGMDCLARNLGLDIEALARELAMNNDGRKPIQCLDVDDDADMEKNEDSDDPILGEDPPNGSLLKV
jgi:hypothetical protein